MPKRILVVEDDDTFRDSICDVLKEKFKVVAAPNGKSATELLSIQQFDLVISDIQMPKMTGLELLEWSKANTPNVPFIIMTGFSTLFETQSAYDLGAKGFVTKPFKINDFLKEIMGALGPLDEKKDLAQKVDDVYCKVSIDEFVTKPKIDFDVYIRLSNTNIIKIANKNQELPTDQLTNYKNRGVKFLYILKEDFNKLVQFNFGLVKLMKDRDDISPEKKANFMKYTGEVLLERTFIEGVNKEIIQDVSSFVSLTVETMLQSKENYDLLQVLKNYSDETYAHSLGVSMYAIMIAKALGLESTVTHFKLGMAGILHDIGKKEIDKELLKKPRHLLTRDERKEFESHAVRGQEILSSMKNMSSDVVKMVYEHHEDQEGQGYPANKSKRDQHPLSKIIQCANLFLDTINLKKDEPTFSVEQTIDNLEKLYGKRIDHHCLLALKQIFNISKVSQKETA